MASHYSVEACRELADRFRRADVLRPLRVGRHDPGTRLEYEVAGVWPARTARVSLEVEAFVGGGFAGQVYRVVVRGIEASDGPIEGLSVGGVYALKIFRPPSRFRELFRDAIYAVGFQGRFSLQVNPSAVRAGALWQKLIRRAGALRFGTERAVVDVLGTFVDPALGSCGEISEWVAGRNWRFELDDRLFGRGRADGADAGDDGGADRPLGSPEYRAKKYFMREMVALLHEVGAPELARQYEWRTCKSQPNVLKRLDSEGAASAGLTAVDFRAGLALLAFLPMSPADFRLIGRGLARGRLVQFDRGDLGRLRAFIDANAEHFADLAGAVDELAALERAYRDSLPDVTHHHVRLLYSGRLWSSILAAAADGWEVRNLVDAASGERFRRRRVARLAFWLLGVVPVLGRFVRRLWGRADYRRHVGRMLTRFGYFRRAMRARAAESLIRWHRAGRVGERRALWLADHSWCFALHLPLLILPACVHRFLTDRRFAWDAVKWLVTRPVRLYFNARLREEWLEEMVRDGRADGMLSDAEAEKILSQVKEPFIQKYLMCLAVHLCTLPITQVVSLVVAVVYLTQHPEFSFGEAWAWAVGILVAFQVTPISPGSLTRGLYVLYVVRRERNYRDYKVAVWLSFWKYIGYLAFPIQMTYRYPTLARLMAGRFAAGAVRIVPVFGEHGALLEHSVFDLFFNLPITLRRRRLERAGELVPAAQGSPEPPMEPSAAAGDDPAVNS